MVPHQTFWEKVAREFWNLRFRLGWAILPSSHKHVHTVATDEWCDVCEVVV